MKKLVITLFLSIATLFGWAQNATIGIKLAPAFSFNRIEGDSETFRFDTDGTGLRFIFGPVVDIPISDNYFFQTGLLYVPKRVGIEANERNTTVTVTETYKTQYLQIPLDLKLYTNEMALDMRLYFTLGLTAEILINEESDSGEGLLIEDFRFFDSSANFGAGVEYKAGTSTVLFGGFSYWRGLVNIVSDANIAEDLSIKNDMLSIDLGIKF